MICDRPPEARMHRLHATAITLARTGITFGSALAIAISWSQNQSILWAIVHGMLSWCYVIYFAIVR
jgi:hypothetical protein